jgi:hypothetical protein
MERTDTPPEGGLSYGGGGGASGRIEALIKLKN